MNKRPPLGWRTHAKLLTEFRQGGIADRWSERRLLILLAEYRLNCRREQLVEQEEAARAVADYVHSTDEQLDLQALAKLVARTEGE